MKISFVTSVEDFNGHGGGNQRSKCFFDALKSLGNESHTLENIVIPFSAFEDLEVAGITNQYMANDIEFAMRLSFALDVEHKGALEFVSKVRDSDVIVIDNCYHYPLVETLSEKLKPSTKIVYLSHNFESILKSEIAESLSWEADSKKRYLDFIRKLEISTWTNSDFRIVCSEEDARNLNQELKAPLKSELIPNGANKRGSIQDDHATYLAAMGFESYVLFVSSGHPPNVKGFMDMLGSDFGFIPPNSRLVIVGTSGPIIRDFFFRSKYWETFRHRVTIIEHATEFELDNLYTHCSAILLPILQGSGTSIKAIEAILTGKKIIGTDFAFRGLHQEVFNPPQVSIAKNPHDFKLKVIESLQNGILDFEPHRIANSYLWSSLVIDARNLLNRIIRKE
jgi:hypothetical protein